MGDVTQILQAVEQGENFSGRLLPLVYGELRKLAAHRMANEAPGHTLQPTARSSLAFIRGSSVSFGRIGERCIGGVSTTDDTDITDKGNSISICVIPINRCGKIAVLSQLIRATKE
jgi:ECF sigma factor